MDEQKNSPIAEVSLGEQVTSVCGGVAAITVLSLVIQLLAMSVIALIDPTLSQQGWYVSVLSSVPMYLCAMPLSYFVFRWGKRVAPSETRRLSVWVILALLALCFGFAMLGNWLGSFVESVISSFTGKPSVNPVEQLTFQTPLWANLLFTGILAPIAEEIVYRKLVIDRLRPLGSVPAVVFSGLLFGLVHGNFTQVFYAALFGFLAGFVYVYTGKLRYTVFLHMAVNLVGGVLSTELIRTMGGAQAAADLTAQLANHPVAAGLYIAYVLLMLLCVVLTPILLILLRKKFRLQKEHEDLTLSQAGKVLTRNPAFWLLAVIFVLMFAL